MMKAEKRFPLRFRTAVPLLAMALLLLPGCGMRRMVVRTATRPIINGTFEAMMAEDDLTLAKTALESNLELVQGLLRSDPENRRLLLLAAQGFTAYSLAFVEDSDPKRAETLYLRGRDFANRWLVEKTGVNLLTIKKLDEFEEAVKKLPANAVPGVFWLGNAWASALMLSLNDITSISNLPRAEALMRFVLAHDEGYYFAGADLFFGAYYGARPAMLGGSPEKAKTYLNRQIELTGGTMLMGPLFKVKYVDIPALDESAAREGLQKILDFDVADGPEESRLVNRIAQAKAKHMLKHIEDYF